MKLSFLTLENVRCFQNEQRLFFSESINLFVGPNNSGKSSILRAIYFLQGNLMTFSDITLDSEGGSTIRIGRMYTDNELAQKVATINGTRTGINNLPYVWVNVKQMNIGEWYGSTSLDGGHITSVFGNHNQFPSEEPNNLIYPYFSNRKVDSYSQVASIAEANKITGTLTNLTAKVDRLMNPVKTSYEIFKTACLEILGFQISSEYSSEGKFTAFSVDDIRSIPISSMGTGVANILGLIVDICTAKNKIFLIEEPENDIHPKALKGLLRLIEAKSFENQFFISTHSNVVVRYLGANQKVKVFQVSPNNYFSLDIKVPSSTITEVSNNPEDRLRLLEDLGYEMFDYGLWKGWLFLEESSAEVMIREFLIPNFTPGLANKLRTYSANSISNVTSKFEDFNNLFVYVHLDPSYRNRAWVIIDDGENERAIINSLKAKYNAANGWSEDNFMQFSKHDFEDFYPATFADDVTAIHAIDGTAESKAVKKQKKREAKRVLVEKVKEWYRANPDQARAEFEQSASEVIKILRRIDAALA